MKPRAISAGYRTMPALLHKGGRSAPAAGGRRSRLPPRRRFRFAFLPPWSSCGHIVLAALVISLLVAPPLSGSQRPVGRPVERSTPRLRRSVPRPGSRPCPDASRSHRTRRVPLALRRCGRGGGRFAGRFCRPASPPPCGSPRRLSSGLDPSPAGQPPPLPLWAPCVRPPPLPPLRAFRPPLYIPRAAGAPVVTTPAPLILGRADALPLWGRFPHPLPLVFVRMPALPLLVWSAHPHHQNPHHLQGEGQGVIFSPLFVLVCLLVCLAVYVIRY